MWILNHESKVHNLKSTYSFCAHMHEIMKKHFWLRISNNVWILGSGVNRLFWYHSNPHRLIVSCLRQKNSESLRNTWCAQFSCKLFKVPRQARQTLDARNFHANCSTCSRYCKFLNTPPIEFTSKLSLNKVLICPRPTRPTGDSRQCQRRARHSSITGGRNRPACTACTSMSCAWLSCAASTVTRGPRNAPGSLQANRRCSSLH